MESVEKCSSKGRETQCVVSDLCGALLRGRNPFCYFLLVCLEGSGVIRSLVLLCAAPLVWLLYNFVSAASAMKLMIFISMRGVKASAIHGVAMAVLPKFFVEDINAEVWRVFSCFGRKVLVTALPRVLVEPFAMEYMGINAVLGTEIQVDGHGFATGFVKPPGYVLSGFRKTEAVRRDVGERIVDVWLHRAGSAAHSSICQIQCNGTAPWKTNGSRQSYTNQLLLHERYSAEGSRKADPLPKYKLPKPVIFHDGRLVQRPDPWIAALTFLWMPLGFLLATIRITAGALLPMRIQYYTFWLTGVRIRVRGNPPDPVNRRKISSGTMFVSSHRTLLDPIMLSASLGRPIAAVTYSISRLSEFLSPIPTVRLTRNRELDAANIRKVLQKGDMVLCPEGTTCREPFLLRYSAMFAELTGNIVPVAVNCRTWMFHGSTSRGWKAMDPFFFFMNPSPVYEIHFLSQIPVDLTCRGGKSCLEVANSVQKITAGVLGFECTNFTRKDKYRLLAGNDGFVRSS